MIMGLAIFCPPFPAPAGLPNYCTPKSRFQAGSVKNGCHLGQNGLYVGGVEGVSKFRTVGWRSKIKLMIKTQNFKIEFAGNEIACYALSIAGGQLLTGAKHGKI
ncbi:MAG: hypothetical protein A2664_00170 [Candidatus Taylorbacteria bacterium RIFCSPHIGHO2_01_FULL_46_22b]|uniref:Uncharacterized protein n=1 Tax=Candidatus Taylorbacteria bacterium RIFCSPHIGHO2_01_FULL_46_22b TaxID=1802301 RepID=A0A1G2M4A7_9BACT|nr:MAG: hypothetical protein A2664_00170 [Candidatus Taylorbacteria bacterium RIFCSPHIGHO2_01_FULL_46_22b]